jgi:hypothetical protein
MAQDYLSIIGNWDSMAQQGRQRANATVETKLKTLDLQMKNYKLQQETEAAAEQRISNISQQAEALAKFYRPGDLEKMQVVEEDAKAKLKEQLNMYNDDITAFMRSGGRQHINEYRDSVLNSDEAQIIRNNHQSLLKYMDQMDEDPALISDRDLENYHKWKNSEVDAFIFTGAYQKLDEPTQKDLTNAEGDVAVAWLHKNYDKVLHNYLKDTGIDFGADGRNPQDYYQDLLIYQYNKLGPKELEEAKDMLSDVDAKKRSYSSSIQSIFDSINGSYTGEFDPTVNEEGQLISGFWFDQANNSALKNLEQVAWINPYDVEEGGRNKRLYGQRLLVGEELAIAKEFFPNMKNGKVTFEDLEAFQVNIGSTSVYDEDGELIGPGEREANDFGFWNQNDDWNVHGLELMFKIDLDNGQTKLLSKDDLSDNPDYRDREKKAVMVMSFNEQDGYQLGTNPSDFRYMELNLESPRVAKKIDKVLGGISYDAKMNIKSKQPTYKYQKGELFKWTPDNVNGLVVSLDPYVSKVFKQHNHTEYDLDTSSILMATAMLDNENENPYFVLEELAKSREPEELQLIETLKDGDYDAYYDLLTSFGATEKEIRRLIDGAARIKMGYLTYGERQPRES